MSELRQMIETLSLEELEEFKKPIETLITNNRQKDRKSPRQSAHQYHQKEQQRYVCDTQAVVYQCVE